MLKIIKSNYFDLLAIFLLFIITFGIRWITVDRIPYGLEGDEVSWAITSLLSQYQIPVDSKGLAGYHDNVATIFPVSIFINRLGYKIFGVDIFSARKILILISALAVVSFYILNRFYFSAFVSLIISTFFSLSSYKLITSKVAEPHSYSDIFLYFSFICFLVTYFLKFRFKYFFAFISGLGMTLTLLTYNLAYWIPLLLIVTHLFALIFKKILIKDFILILVIFLIPLILTSRHLITGFKSEFDGKKYALNNLTIDLDNKKINLVNIKRNSLVVFNQLFNKLFYETADFLVWHNSSLISRWISISALFGLIFALFQFKKYFFVILYSFLFIAVTVMTGFYLPRMWMIGVASFFILSGITISQLLEFFRQKKLYFIYVVILLIFSFFVVKSELQVFYTEAINNQSYPGKHREITDLARKYEKNLSKNVYFVSAAEINTSLIYPIATFYYLAVNPGNFELIRKTDIEFLNIFTPEEFQKIPEGINNNKRLLIIDNSLFYLISKNYKFKLIKRNSFFSEFIQI